MLLWIQRLFRYMGETIGYGDLWIIEEGRSTCGSLHSQAVLHCHDMEAVRCYDEMLICGLLPTLARKCCEEMLIRKCNLVAKILDAKTVLLWKESYAFWWPIFLRCC